MGDESDDIVIRRARPSDRDDVMAVLETANFHHVPSPEMPELDLSGFFVAERDGEIVGVAGYTVLEDGRGKTTLMAVRPEHRGLGIGGRLQERRMLEMLERGCDSVVTNADLPATIDWYRRKFGYEKVGTLEKKHEFGDPDVDRWTTLEADLRRWFREREAEGAETGGDG